MKCLVVNGQTFYDPIQGFDFVPGTHYDITVARTRRDTPPADASAYQYTLLDIHSAEIVQGE